MLYLALEMYDFRCTDVKKMTFPNHCHSNYSNEKFWTTITDKVDVQFVGESTSKLIVINVLPKAIISYTIMRVALLTQDTN